MKFNFRLGKFRFIFYAILLGVLSYLLIDQSFINQCVNSFYNKYYNESYQADDSTSSEQYIKYIKDKSVGVREQNVVSNIELHQYQLYGEHNGDFLEYSAFKREVDTEGRSRIICNSLSNFNIINGKYINTNTGIEMDKRQFGLSHLCEFWNVVLNDSSVFVVPETELLQSINGITSKLVNINSNFSNEKFQSDIYIVDDYLKENANGILNRNSSSLTNILNHVQVQHLRRKLTVAPIGIAFPISAPYVVINSTEDFILDFLYDQNILPVVSIGNTYVTDSYNGSDFVKYNETNLPYSEVYCRNYSVNCIFTNNSSYIRSPHSLVVGTANYDKTKNRYSSAGSNIWMAAYGNDKDHRQAVVSTTLAIGNLVVRNSTLTIEQIKYILAKSSDTDVVLHDYGVGYSRGWQTNGAGNKFSSELGFGILDMNKAVVLVDYCLYFNECAVRSYKPDFNEFLTAYKCTEKIEDGLYNYKCRINVKEKIMIENLQLDLGNIAFKEKDGYEYCNDIGTLKGFADRRDSLKYLIEITDVLRDMIITINSNLTDNQYTVKFKHENFYGSGSVPVDFNYKENASFLITTNQLYGEKFDGAGYIDVNIKTVCPITYKNYAVGAKVSAYRLR